MDSENQKANNDSSLPMDAIAALHLGNKIAAIKIVRKERNIGLKEAKDAVEDYVRTMPALQTSLATAQAEARSGPLLWGAVLIVLALLAYFFR